MFEVVDFSTWEPYEGLSEGSGRSEKSWLIAPDGKIGLFKYPKTGSDTSEHISEHLASQIGNLLNIKTATIDIGRYHGRMGSMSYLVNESNESVIEGIALLSGVYPRFNANTLQDEETGEYYCINQLARVTHGIISPDFFTNMMLFDYIIGNSDRHQSNWAIIAVFPSQKDGKITFRECPLYDNGSSLCAYVQESQINEYRRDKLRLNSLVDTKSRSCIRIDGHNKSRPRHSDVIRYIISAIPGAKETAASYVDILLDDAIDSILLNYSPDVLSPQKNDLICMFLKKKMELLKQILEDA